SSHERRHRSRFYNRFPRDHTKPRQLYFSACLDFSLCSQLGFVSRHWSFHSSGKANLPGIDSFVVLYSLTAVLKNRRFMCNDTYLPFSLCLACFSFFQTRTPAKQAV